MMKKTLAAVAVLGAFAGSAMAADVTLYGRIDTGFMYTDTNDVSKFEMKSGQKNGSRWGVKGTEDLGNGMKVGFILEGGFNSDDGTPAQAKSAGNERLFGREATLSLYGDFGRIAAGRIASVASDSGSMGIFGDLDPFGTSYNYAAMTNKTGSAMTRYDNVLGYASPKFGGVQIHAQYAMGDAADNKAVGNARYGVVAANYKAGALTLLASAEHYDYDNAKAADDGMSFIVGGNYKTDFATFYGFANYFQDITGVGETFGLGGKAVAVDGYGVSFAAAVPACGGKFMASVGYRDMEASEDSSAEGNRMSGSVGFEYALSKRTTAYVVGTYVKEEWKDADQDGYQIGTGIVHKF